MITYLKGDATKPADNRDAIIVHVCNNIGKWGSGFVLAISKKWKLPEQRYRALSEYNLGSVDFVYVCDGNLVVANMIAQHATYSKNNPLPLQYDALRECLKKVAEFAKRPLRAVHMPRIGCGLARGDWNKVEAIIKEELADLSVFVYDLEDLKERS